MINKYNYLSSIAVKSRKITLGKNEIYVAVSLHLSYEKEYDSIGSYIIIKMKEDFK